MSEGEVNTFKIMASAGAGGTINPSGVVTVGQGESQTFSITPDDGYVVTDVIVDGASVGAAAGYTFSNVSSEHSIEASFTSSSTGDGGQDDGSGSTDGGENDGGSSFNANGDVGGGGGCFISTL